MRALIFFVAVLCCPFLVAQVDLNDGLVAYYPFNGNADDESGNGHHPQSVDAPALTEDCNGTPQLAYSFNGFNDKIIIPSHSGLNFATDQAFAIAFWMRAPQEQANGTNSGEVMGKWNSTSLSVPYPFTIRLANQNSPNAGRITGARFDGSCDNQPKVTSDSRLDNAKWHHVVFQRTTDDMLELYISGQLEDSTVDETSCPTQNTESIMMGMRSTLISSVSRPFTGTLDEVRFYNRALNHYEIAILSTNCIISSVSMPTERDVSIFPNPVKGHKINIQVSGHTIQSTNIHDANGRFLGPVVNGELPYLDSGIYFLKITLADGSVLVKRLLIHGSTTRV